MVVDIIGAGIGGLTLGIALKKKGISVRVFEQAKEIKAVGAGIILANNAMQVYRELGLSDEISKKGNSISEIEITDAQFKTINKTSLVGFEEEYQLKNIAIHRGVLQQILVQYFNDEELFLNHELKNIKEIDDKKILEFENGKAYDSFMVIGADGIFSKVRELLFAPVTIRNAKQVCWRGVLDYSLQNINKATEAWGKKSRFGYVQIDTKKVYWYALESVKTIDEDLPSKMNKKLFSQYHPQVLALIDNTEETQIHTAFIQDVKPFKRWSKNNVCLIGDAAHATTPNMGQGACQAIEDAYVLASYLHKFDHVDKAFMLYEESRIAKAHQVVKTSFMIGKISQLSNPVLMFLRNTVFKMIPSKVNEKQMRSVFKIVDVS